MKGKISLILVLLILVGAVGCSSGQTQTAQTNQDNQAAQQTTQQAPKETKKELVSEGKPLKDVLSTKLTAYTAEYTISAEGVSQKMTMAIDYPKYSTLITTNQGDVKTIIDDKNIISCNNMQGGWNCLKLTTKTGDTMDTEKSITGGEIIPTYIGTCSRAGENGLKYQYTANGETATICYTNDGILLESVTKQATMQATKITRSVDDGAFVAPAQVKDLSSMIPQGYTVPTG